MSDTKVSSVDMGIRLTAPPANSEQRVNHSAWFITINSNKGADQCDVSRLANEWHAYMRRMFGEDKLVARFIEFNITEHTYKKHIKHVNSRIVTELGQHAMGGRVHSHIFFQVEHYSSIKLNRYVMEDMIINAIKTCPLDSVYINWKLVGHAGAAIEAYMSKYVREANS